jgi:enterochelin esterase family protein
MKNPDKMPLCILIILLILSLTCGNAQEAPRDSIFLHPDGSVTFLYQNPDAKSVKVYCDCKLRKETPIIRTENYHSAKMSKDSSGLWAYTTPPLPPEVYTYQFGSDSRRFPDPNNPDSIRVQSKKMSVFILNGTPQTDLYVSNPMYGRMDTLVFQSANEEKPRRVIVYTPPHYSESVSYPVLYLLHGLNGNETAWNDRGRAAQILDNLIVQEKAKPMILVMPDANPVCLISQKEEVGLFKNILLYHTWNKMEFEKCYPEIDSFLSERYSFSARPGHRAVAGLSAGAKQSANLANLYDSTFSSIGLFSPVVGKKQLPQSTYSQYWISGGTGDLFHYRINKFCKRMQRKHVPYTMYSSAGGHTWRNWRVYFSEYVRTLFWRE